VIEEPAGARLRLVHGWCWNGVFYYDHAWVLLPSGRVYDAVEDKYFSTHDYAVQYRAIVGRVYSRKQAAKAFIIQHKHSGPWWTDDEMRMHVPAGLPTGWCKNASAKRRAD
jgi:hypothetical protein